MKHIHTTYSERLTAAMKYAEKSRKDVADALSISQAAVGRILNIEGATFTAENNSIAAQFLNVDTDWLATGEGTMERRIEDSNVFENHHQITQVPHISWVKAGPFEESNWTDETWEPDYYVATTARVSKNAFSLTVNNDSMVDLDGGPYSFPEGREIIGDPEKECRVGSFVIAKDTRTQKTTFKKLTSDGFNYFLTSLNKNYAPIPINEEHIRIIAKVVDSPQELP